MKVWPLEALFAGAGGVAFPRMTALVGAGGKTTLMYALAARMAGAGRRVVCTTTTKIFPPENGLPLVLLEGVADPVRAVHEALCAAPCIVVAGRLLPDVRKLEGVSPRTLAALAGALPDARFLVEADGAARKPLKAPAAHEPVLPERPDCCVAVIGLDSVGKPLDGAHVHRSAQACAVAGQEPGSPVTPATLACLAEHAGGLFRNCPEGCRRLVFANKADRPDALAAASEAAARSLSAVWFAGSAAQGWCVPLGTEAQRTLGMVPFRDLPC